MLSPEKKETSKIYSQKSNKNANYCITSKMKVIHKNCGVLICLRYCINKFLYKHCKMTLAVSFLLIAMFHSLQLTHDIFGFWPDTSIFRVAYISTGFASRPRLWSVSRGHYWEVIFSSLTLIQSPIQCHHLLTSVSLGMGTLSSLQTYCSVNIFLLFKSVTSYRQRFIIQTLASLNL